MEEKLPEVALITPGVVNETMDEVSSNETPPEMPMPPEIGVALAAKEVPRTNAAIVTTCLTFIKSPGSNVKT
jgi:hypothetical protein